ncbi:HNH endonuclease [Cereibacter changlensis]|uniref:HNH endonuclease n=1 Tax=Cereibacter changlensis TaxID=402884 RepID=A0A4U0Z2Q5_9RHOB|nr:HNH endonuclease [Cereibacter changlensis]TKA98548.1 HNH endonuclease [Cereibacter changlensis]
MPVKPPRICGCGRVVAAGLRCACQAARDTERKARFDKTRPNSSARGYGSAWEKARAAFLRSHPHCRRCGALATVVDHIEPHRGDQTLFWDKTNWQPLCATHHNSAKQREERRASRGPKP